MTLSQKTVLKQVNGWLWVDFCILTGVTGEKDVTGDWLPD